MCRRAGIPHGVADKRILHVISHFQCKPVKVLDLAAATAFWPNCSYNLFRRQEPFWSTIPNRCCTIRLNTWRELQERCTFVEADLEGDISAYAEPGFHELHCIRVCDSPFTAWSKKKLYSKIFNILKPGGVFVNMEHTASATAGLEQLHDALFVDHLAAYNDRPRAEVKKE
jgi:tRNA (cmo5U34)-methyltransferase